MFSGHDSLILFGDTIPLTAWAGMKPVIVSAIAAIVARARAMPGTPAEEH